jgi:hypothetical protein
MWKLMAVLVLAVGGDDLARSTRVIQPEVRRAFYRSGGRYLLGKKVHLHVESSVLRKRPLVLQTRTEGELLAFENRSVPVVVFSLNPYWKQVQRHLTDAKEICLKGVLQIPPWDERRRIHLMATRIKRAPGTWR